MQLLLSRVLRIADEGVCIRAIRAGALTGPARLLNHTTISMTLSVLIIDEAVVYSEGDRAAEE